MARRNGADVVESTVEVRPDGHGSYNVVSVLTIMEYTGASRDFAEFLASELREKGLIYPVPTPDSKQVYPPLSPEVRASLEF
jgi:hypothetical protein